MIKGFQNGNLNTKEKVIACAKHLIAGGEPINGLNASPMDVSERTLKEIHLPPYKKRSMQAYTPSWQHTTN